MNIYCSYVKNGEITTTKNKSMIWETAYSIVGVLAVRNGEVNNQITLRHIFKSKLIQEFSSRWQNELMYGKFPIQAKEMECFYKYLS